MRTTRIVALVMGALAALVALGLLAGGGAMLWAHATQRDGDGYYTAPTERFESPTYAVTSDRIDLRTDQGEGEWNPLDDVGTLRVRAERPDGGAVFVGIAEEDEVERYLRDSAHDEVVEVEYDPFRARYRTDAGEQRPAAPGAQPFWVAAAEGTGRQTVSWEVDDGEWAVVVMNADASRAVSADVTVGISSGWLLPIGAGLVAGGLLTAGVAVALLVFGARDGGRPGNVDGVGDTRTGGGAVTAPPAVPAGPYPVRLEGVLEHDGRVSRWLWLVKWFLAIPHVVALAVLWPAMAVLTVVAGVAILFTGRYPRGLFDFNVGVLRWTWRVTFYALTLGTDRYPPFTLRPDPTYPATLDVAYPGALSRPLVLVKWWLLALPHHLVISVFGGGVTWWTWSRLGADDGGELFAGGLVGLLVLIAAVVLLFTGRYPRQVFDFVMGMQRWTYRVFAYAGLMTDAYPPFRLDTGGSEPTAGPPAVPPAPDRDPDLATA